MSFLLRLIESYIFILLFSLGVGLLFSDFGKLLSPFSTPFLQIIFFLSSLKLDIHDIKREIGNGRTILLVNLSMLVLFPVLTYGLALLGAPGFAIPLLLLATMPAGMTSPLLTEIVGGSVGLALALTVTTSLLAPITVPAMVSLLAGTSISVPAVAMFTTLFTVIVIPFILAQIIRRLFHDRIRATFATFKPLSILLLCGLIIGIVSEHAATMMASGAQIITALIVLAVFFVLLHIVGYWGLPSLTHEQRLSVTICLTYRNFTLAIYLAGRFFPQSDILLPVVLSVFPWSLGIIPFRWLSKKHDAV